MQMSESRPPRRAVADPSGGQRTKGLQLGALVCLWVVALGAVRGGERGYLSSMVAVRCWAQEVGEPATAPGEAAAPAPAAVAAPAAPSGPFGERLVSNVFFDTDIRQALFDVGTQTGATIIPDESVDGFITLDLENVPLERALRLMLLPGGFVYDEVEDGVYLVTSPRPESPGFARIARTEIVELNYIDSEELTSLLPNLYSAFVKFDKVGNRVTVTAPPALLEETVSVIKSLDTAPLQIMIEALVIETSKRALDNFRASLQGKHLGLDSSTGLMTYVGQAEQLLHELTAMVGKEEAAVRASPRVVAQEGKEATVKVAVEQYFQIISGRVGWEYINLQAIEAAVSLAITPRVAREDRMVTCTIKPEVGDVTGVSATDLPIITKRSAEGTVRVADGQVIAIGGLLQEIKRETKRKIPLLGDLPLLGPLFQSKSSQNDTREIIIFIVPHILDEQGRFSGPLLTDRPAEVEAAGRAEGVTAPPVETEAERESRRDLIRERVRQREAAPQPATETPSAGGLIPPSPL